MNPRHYLMRDWIRALNRSSDTFQNYFFSSKINQKLNKIQDKTSLYIHTLKNKLIPKYYRTCFMQIFSAVLSSGENEDRHGCPRWGIF